MSQKLPMSVLVFDGHCAFCRAQMERVRRMDREGRFEYLPNDHPSVFQRFPQLKQDVLQSGLRLITPDGRVHVGADAVYEVGRRLPHWEWVAWMYRLPGCHLAARRVYGRIAANRYRLAGGCDGDVCARS